MIIKGDNSSDDEDTDRQHIEKIMLRRLKKRETKQEEDKVQDRSNIEDLLDETEKEKEDTDDYEYYVKWTGTCYRKVGFLRRTILF